jgi:hypothetical protein
VELVLPVCTRYGLAIAGGYAIKAHGLVTRPSDDIDFATADAAPVHEILAALQDAYQQAGLGVQMLGSDLRKGHLLVTVRPFISPAPSWWPWAAPRSTMSSPWKHCGSNLNLPLCIPMTRFARMDVPLRKSGR